MTMMKKHTVLYSIIILLLFFCFPEVIISSSTSYYFRTLGINDGLSQSTVNAILQDQKGFMWIGTKDGLNQYDGQECRVFQKENSSLGNNFITALYEDCEGYIWVGTDAGVYIYNPVQEAFQFLDTEIASSGEKITRAVTWITSDSQNNIWISVDNQGLFCYNRGKKNLTKVVSCGKSGIANVTHFWFYAGQLWIARYEDNLYVSKDNSSFNAFNDVDGEDIFKGLVINSYVEGVHNCLYVGTSKGFMEINLPSRKVRKLLDEYVRDICFRSDTDLWIGTEQGLYIYNIETDEYEHLTSPDIDERYALSDNAIYSVYKDREAGMWVGSYFGGLN